VAHGQIAQQLGGGAIGRQRGTGELLAEGDAGREEPTTRRTVRRSN
jgi:hypothetical protein